MAVIGASAAMAARPFALWASKAALSACCTIRSVPAGRIWAAGGLRRSARTASSKIHDGLLPVPPKAMMTMLD
jgi:hypothetical protein